ncbi:MAG: type II secretion system protein GspL [Myxococcota bacterium]
MPILKNVLGLDVGSHGVKAVELQQGLRSLQAVNVKSVERESELPLAELVQRLVHVHRLSTDHVVTAVRGDRLSVRRLSFPFSERRRLAQAVPFEIEDALPFDLEDVVLDWDPLTSERHRGDVIAAIAPRAAVSELIECLHQAGCDPRTVEAEGLVLANLRALFELPGDRLLVDLGHSKTTFCALSEAGPVAARSFQVAGAALTEAIAQDRALPLEEAEREKLEHGIVDPVLGRVLPKASAVIEQIAGEMVRFAASIENLLPGGIQDVTLVGGTAQLDRIEELLAERTGFDVQRLGLPRAEEGAGLVAGGSPVLFGPAIALALRGTARGTTDMNFRQDEFARRLDFGRYRRDFGVTAVLAAIVLALALVSFVTNRALESAGTGDVEAQIAALYQQAFPGQAVPGDPVRALRDAVRDAQGRAEFLGVYSGNLSALDLLQEISKRIPEDLDVTFEELSIDGQTIRIRVIAGSFEAADRLGSELKGFAPFAQTRIGAIETDRITGDKKFQVTISLVSEESA